jgi:hypothetical protein
MQGRIGQRLIDVGAIDRFILCNVAYGGASAYDLSPSGQIGHRLPLAFAALRSLGIPPSRVDIIMSHLGETDGIRGTSSATFQAQRQESISVARNSGFTGPWLMANSTYAYGNESSVIQGAIAALVANTSLNVRAGADSDAWVGPTYRYPEQGTGNTLVHPNMAGLIAISDDWVVKIRAALGI